MPFTSVRTNLPTCACAKATDRVLGSDRLLMKEATYLTGGEDDEQTNKPEGAEGRHVHREGCENRRATPPCEECKLIHFHAPSSVLVTLGPTHHYKVDDQSDNDRDGAAKNRDRLREPKSARAGPDVSMSDVANREDHTAHNPIRARQNPRRHASRACAHQ